jgi:hypothetical protein
MHRDREVLLAEYLARAVSASSKLRGILDGITVCVSSCRARVRSSPGLECCAEAVERNATERRRASTSFSSSSSSPRSRRRTVAATMDGGDGERAASLGRLRDVSPERSPLAIVAVRPEDLECIEDHHHHHHHHRHPGDSPASDRDGRGDGDTSTTNCRISTEWNGRGEYNSFADRAMLDWRRVWRDDVVGVEGSGARVPPVDINGCGGGVRPKVQSISRVGRREAADDDDMQDDVSEPISTVMVILFLAVVVAQVWNNFGDTFLAYYDEW